MSIPRKTPLKRGTDGLAQQRAFKPKGKLKRPPMDPKLRDLVYARAGARCDCCGRPLHRDTWEAHHRLLRKRGGKDSLENLVALCPSCHVPYVHAKPAEATSRGLMVNGWDDPADVPVRRADGRLYKIAGRRWLPIPETDES